MVNLHSSCDTHQLVTIYLWGAQEGGACPSLNPSAGRQSEASSVQVIHRCSSHPPWLCWHTSCLLASRQMAESAFRLAPFTRRNKRQTFESSDVCQLFVTAAKYVLIPTSLEISTRSGVLQLKRDPRPFALIPAVSQWEERKRLVGLKKRGSLLY